MFKAAEDLASKAHTLEHLQNEVILTQAQTTAIQSEVASIKSNQDLDHASAAEEKDGRLNEE